MITPINMADRIADALFLPTYQSEQRWESLPPFDLDAALTGAPYMHRLDARRWRSYRDCRRIEGDHPAVIIWAGEWLVYPIEDEKEMERLDDSFRMVPPERRVR